MYIKELTIANYKSFHGEHVFRLRRGANIIAGASGTGKTNLCKAVEFALFGGVAMDLLDMSSLVNNRLADEAKTECRWIGCTVKMVLEDSVEEHWVERDFSPFQVDLPTYYQDHVREDAIYSMHVSHRISPHGYRDYVYVDENLSGLERTGTSARVDGERALEYLLGLAERSVASGLGLMILDDSLSRLPARDADRILKGLAGSGLDQVILLVHHSVLSLEDSAYRLGETIESVTFKVEDFPFDPSHLRREIEHMVDSSYVKRGDVYEREVYGQKYTVEAVEVTPNGARYQSSISSLTVT